MSSKPNPNQAGELRQCAATVREMDVSIIALRAQIATAQASLDKAVTCRDRNAARVVELLRLMDCAANHNTGWEGRITWLLSELVEQAEQMGKRMPK